MNLDVKLGKRQQEVAEFVGFGYSIKETADLLKMPFNTVKSTLKAVYLKIGIQKATELSKFVFCRRFDIPLSMCEPMRRVGAVILLVIYIGSMAIEENTYTQRIRRNVRTERIERLSRRQFD